MTNWVECGAYGSEDTVVINLDHVVTLTGDHSRTKVMYHGSTAETELLVYGSLREILARGGVVLTNYAGD